MVEQELKIDLCEEEKWFGVLVVHSVLLCRDDWISCGIISSQVSSWPFQY